jgi:hypothetical protein
MKGFFMNYINKLFLITVVFLNIHEACPSELKNQIKDNANELNSKTKKTIKHLQKRLVKTKKKHAKLLKKLIAKNINKAEREKDKNLIILKREIENITNQLNNLSRN